MERGAQIGDALTNATQAWFQAHFPLGPSDSEKQQLIDDWVHILSSNLVTTTPFGTTGSRLFSWHGGPGDHWLPDIIATFLDGEAEQVVDELYADFATGLPRYQVLARISFLEASLRHCVEAAPEPHRPVPQVRPGLHHPKVNSRVSQPVCRSFGSRDRGCSMYVSAHLLTCQRFCSWINIKTVSDLPVANVQVISIMHALHQLTAESSWQVIVLSLDTAVSQAPCLGIPEPQYICLGELLLPSVDHPTKRLARARRSNQWTQPGLASGQVPSSNYILLRLPDLQLHHVAQYRWGLKP